MGDRTEQQSIGAVVLTGGNSVRLDGADKASVEIGGLTLLEHCLGALVDVPEVVVVGPSVPTSRPVTFTREDPPGGGPAAGLLAGLRGFPRLPDWVLALAVDMPMVTSATIRRLLAAAAYDGAALIDRSRRLQYLCAIYSVSALDRARPSLEEEHGLAMRTLVGRMRLEQVPSLGSETEDVDSWADLRRLRQTLEE